jgi:hypothetical protein
MNTRLSTEIEEQINFVSKFLKISRDEAKKKLYKMYDRLSHKYGKESLKDSFNNVKKEH